MSNIVHIAEKDRLAELSERLAAIDAERAALVAEMEVLAPGPARQDAGRPLRHGHPWLAEEKALVAALYTEGRAVNDIAAMQKRTRGSIRSELIKQGLIELEPGDAVPENVTPSKPIRTPLSAPDSDSCTITPEFAKAFELLENTQTNVFLTGKAGTGKSTFLQYFREHTRKKMAVVAPTGVAALNVGAQTIHSFFRLKPGFVDLKTLKPSRTRVLRNLELLIIDEISMVRADMFDGIDRILKLVRKNNAPFGGVQLCVIGDLFQLPPVITREEMYIYSQFYTSPFFFCAKAYAEADFTPIQFSIIHRQKDAGFIQILNAIRAGTCDADELNTLNSRLSPKATPAPGTLVLTTTNMLAEDINRRKLDSLTGKIYAYQGEIEGNFGLQGTRLPAPETLILKIGAQVMFVKNDMEGRWVNGTVGTVQALDSESVTVCIGDEDHEVEREK